MVDVNIMMSENQVFKIVLYKRSLASFMGSYSICGLLDDHDGLNFDGELFTGDHALDFM